MNDRKVNEVKKILVDWNPLGDKSIDIKDLNNYETEANDILFYIENNSQSDKKGSLEKRIEKIIKEVLNEAFDLYLTNEDCHEPALKIAKV
ncbi:hypothetical protein [Gillisia sp. JM1]|jgi:hypothetical protein|uniref:hypothetical protein n=1 Tax=Gillisia sp. JM1 TaxID=1283286 RepID=UPI0003F84023|nr:hypothetical protein [Gillisia sp. JM1]